MSGLVTAGAGAPRSPRHRHEPARVATAFLLVSMVVMVATLGLALIVQTTAGYLACAGMYIVKVSAERHFGITSPLSLALLASYVALAGLSLTSIDMVGYTGVLVFSVLTLVVGGLLVAGRPFTTYYSHGKGDPLIHRAVSLIWLLTYLAAIVATLALIPDKSYLVVPPAICLLGGIGTLFVNFVWCGSARQREFEVNELQFAEIAREDPRFDEVCRFYAEAIVNHPQQERGLKTVANVTAAVRAGELALGTDSHLFACYQHGRIVGSIRCIVDRPGRPMPTEADVGFSLDPLRRFGRVMAVGRLAIAEDLRHRPDVVSNLFACFIDLALERDISYVLSDGFRHIVPSYLKVGFEMLFDRRDPRHSARMSHGYVCYPVLLDFTHMIFERVRNDGAKVDFYAVTNKSLAERWYKRALVRHWLHSAIGRRRPVSIDEVRQLLAQTGSAGPATNSAR